MKSIMLSIMLLSSCLFSKRSFANTPEKSIYHQPMEICTGVYKIIHDDEDTYKIVNLRGDFVIVDEFGVIVKNLGSDAPFKTATYELVKLPAKLIDANDSTCNNAVLR